MSFTNEIVVCPTGTTSLKSIVVPVLDSNGNARDLTGGTVKLQGVSGDISTTINATGTITDAVGGIATWAAAGNLITEANLGAKPSATYTFRVQFTDAAGKVDWTPWFTATFVPKPAV